MNAIYEAPSLVSYGSVAVLTSSLKCSPGGDALLDGTSASDTDLVIGNGSDAVYNVDGPGVSAGQIIPNATAVRICTDLSGNTINLYL